MRMREATRERDYDCASILATLADVALGKPVAAFDRLVVEAWAVLPADVRVRLAAYDVEGPRAELSWAGQRRNLRPRPATTSRATAIAIMFATSIVPIPPQVQLCKSPPAAMARYLTAYDFKLEPPVRLYDEADGHVTGFIQRWWWQGRVGALVRAHEDRACVTAQLRRS